MHLRALKVHTQFNKCTWHVMLSISNAPTHKISGAGGAKHTESPSLLAPCAVECMLLNQHASSATETKLFGEVLALSWHDNANG